MTTRVDFSVQLGRWLFIFEWAWRWVPAWGTWPHRGLLDGVEPIYWWWIWGPFEVRRMRL